MKNGITTASLRKSILVINAKQKIHYPIVLPSEEIEKQQDNNDYDVSIHGWLESSIRRLGDSAPSPIFLQPKPVVVQKNFKEIPDDWLEMQLSALLKWEIYEASGPDLSAVFRIYDENDSRICLCQFIDPYHTASPSFSLDSYFSSGISLKKPEKNTKPLKYLNKHKPEECEIMGELLKSPNTPMPTLSSINLTNQYYSYLITRTRTLPNTEKLSGCIANSSNGSERFSETKISDDGSTSGNAHVDTYIPPYQPQAANPIPKTEAIREGKPKPMTAKETFDFPGLESFEAEIGYRHLIETEDMPTLGMTAYSCKEHPEI